MAVEQERAEVAASADDERANTTRGHTEVVHRDNKGAEVVERAVQHGTKHYGGEFPLQVENSKAAKTSDGTINGGTRNGADEPNEDKVSR